MSSIEKAIERLREGSAIEKQVEQTDPEQTYNASKSNNKIHKIDFDALKKQGFLTPEDIQSKISEEYRVLKRPILKNAFGKNTSPSEEGNLIMVTSSIPGEGKTFTALNLAMSISLEKDTTVLLVDSDVINPSLSKILNLHDRYGIIDLLTDTSLEVSDVIVNTNIPQLRIIPSGLPHEHSTELLASDKMKALAHEISRRYTDRVILFDSPPLLLASQAAVLSQLMGQILIIVEAGETTKENIKSAIDLLDHQKAIGLVLNKTPKGSSGSYYGTYYSSIEK
jgi:protein-tyrosine kinase